MVASRAPVGGGSLPGVELEGAACRIEWPGLAAGELARRLRTGEPPVIGRIAGGALRLDPRAFLPGEAELLVGALESARAPGPRAAGPGEVAGPGTGDEDE